MIQLKLHPMHPIFLGTRGCLDDDPPRIDLSVCFAQKNYVKGGPLFML